MPFKAILAATLYAALLLPIAAQQPAPLVSGITIPDVAGVPFSATAVLEVERYWPDGSTQARRTINLIARDAQGRTHNEVRRLMPEYFHGSPELMSVRLFDPLTRVRTIYEPAPRIARREIVPKKNRAAAPPNPLLHIENLGTTTLNGLEAKGTRRTLTVYSGSGDPPVEIEDEYWYSEELHLNLLVRHSDPRVGIETVGVSNLKREEPPASMFRVPMGYKVLDLTPAPSSPSGPAPPGAKPESEPPS
jgi:hypothetical protein